MRARTAIALVGLLLLSCGSLAASERRLRLHVSARGPYRTEISGQPMRSFPGQEMRLRVRLQEAFAQQGPLDRDHGEFVNQARVFLLRSEAPILALQAPEPVFPYWSSDSAEYQRDVVMELERVPLSGPLHDGSPSQAEAEFVLQAIEDWPAEYHLVAALPPEAVRFPTGPRTSDGGLLSWFVRVRSGPPRTARDERAVIWRRYSLAREAEDWDTVFGSLQALIERKALDGERTYPLLAQLAEVREQTGDIAGAIEAYQEALDRCRLERAECYQDRPRYMKPRVRWAEEIERLKKLLTEQQK